MEITFKARYSHAPTSRKAIKNRLHGLREVIKQGKFRRAQAILANIDTQLDHRRGRSTPFLHTIDPLSPLVLKMHASLHKALARDLERSSTRGIPLTSVQRAEMKRLKTHARQCQDLAQHHKAELQRIRSQRKRSS